MTAGAFSERRELAHRTSNGIDVTLFWSKCTNQVTVDIVDLASGEILQVPVESQSALEAFNHPYVYAVGVPA